MKHFIQKTTRIGLSLCLLAVLVAGMLSLVRLARRHTPRTKP